MKRFDGRNVSIRARDYLVYRALIPSLTFTVREVLTQHSERQELTVVDVGCGQRPYEKLFEGSHYIGLNYGAEGAQPDIVGDATNLPFRSSCVDIVFSTQVIEHVPKPQQMLNEAYRVLKSGGHLVLSGPFYWPLHEEPHDYFRFTEHGLRHMLGECGFSDVHIFSDSGSLTQVAVSCIEVLPRPLFWLVPLINLVTPLLQRQSKDRRSTLNYVLRARKP